MTLELLSLSGSPFGWKVQLALEHKQLPYTMTWLSPDKGDLRVPELRAQSPHGKLPVLVDGYFVLSESDAIVDYVAEGFPGPDLWPRAARERARARRIAVEASSYLYPPTRALVKEWAAARDPEPATVAEAKERLAECLGLLAREVRGLFFTGAAPTGADFAVFPLVALLRRLHERRPEQDLRSVLPETLAEWSERIVALPGFDRTYPPHWRAR